MEKVIVIIVFVAVFLSAVYYIKQYMAKKRVNKSNGSGGSGYPVNNVEEEKNNK